MKVLQKYIVIGLLMFSLRIDSLVYNKVKSRDSKFIEKLTQAIELNKTDKVQELLQTAHKDDLNQALFQAVLDNHYDTAKLILQAGVDPDFVDGSGRSLLSWVVDRSYVEIIRLLLEFGADPNILNQSGESALYQAINKGNVEIVRLLLEFGADSNSLNKENQSVLQKAVETNQFDLVKLLLQAGADVNRVDKYGQFILDKAFQKATFHRRYDIMKLVLEFKANPNISNRLGEWILNRAVGSGDVKAVQLLLEFGADPQNRDKQTGLAALHIAAQRNDDEIMEILLKEYHADPNIQTLAGATPLHIIFQEIPARVVLHANIACFDVLMKYQADLTAKNEMGYTLLHILAEHYNQYWLGLMKKAIKAGVDVNAQTVQGWTALHLLAKSNKPDRFYVAKELIDNNANPEIKDRAGRTPLDSISPQNPDKEKLMQLFEAYNRDNNVNIDNKRIDIDNDSINTDMKRMKLVE